MIILNNDIYIYNPRSAVDFLYSLGMDDLDIDEFIELISADKDEYTIDYWKQEAKEWEQDSAAQFEKRNNLIVEIQNLSDKLRSGKGGTKAQYADKLLQLCDYWY